MRALMLHKLGEPEDLVLEDITPPVPGAGEVLVDIYSVAVNFPDILTIQGKYQHDPALPFPPGREGAGIVLEAGEGVTRFKPGDRVMVQADYGVFADQVLVPQHECYRVPDEVDFDQAAAIGVAFQTAWFALTDRAQIKEGETVLVTGASGSVGLAAMQLASTWGCRVLAGLTTPSKAGVARQAGADVIIDLSGDNPKDSIRDQVMDLTGGDGVDIVVEMVGGDIFTGALRCVRFRGRMVVVGFTSGVIPEMKTNYLLLKNIAVTGVDRAAYRDQLPDWMEEAQEQIFDYVATGRVKMPVQASFPFEDYIKAFDIIRNREVQGKVVLRLKEES